MGQGEAGQDVKNCVGKRLYDGLDHLGVGWGSGMGQATMGAGDHIKQGLICNALQGEALAASHRS